MIGYEPENQPDFGKETPRDCDGECDPKDCTLCKVMAIVEELTDEEKMIMAEVICD